MKTKRDNDEGDWIRKKLGLPSSATSGELYGEMHVVCAHSVGYIRYIETYKCDDKEGEIARLTVELETLKLRLAQFE